MDQLLIALDVESGEAALDLANSLGDLSGGFKIGSRLFTAEGPELVRAMAGGGARVFLDLKFHDIPTIAAGAVTQAARLGVWMVDVHAAGGLQMMRAAVSAARSARNPPLVTAVTVLTSFNQQALQETGVERPLEEQVIGLALMAQDAGLDGVIASPREASLLRARCGRDFLIVTPGIRWSDSGSAGAQAPAEDDQSRTFSAAEAVQAGASHIVVGRPIIAAPDPRRAAERIVHELAQATSGG